MRWCLSLFENLFRFFENILHRDEFHGLSLPVCYFSGAVLVRFHVRGAFREERLFVGEWTRVVFIGWSEESDDVCADGCGKVGDDRIIADNQLRFFEHGCRIINVRIEVKDLFSGNES